MKDLDHCNNCGGSFSAGEVLHSTLKNRAWAATKDEQGNIIQECCDNRQQEFMINFEIDEELTELELDELNLATGGLA